MSDYASEYGRIPYGGEGAAEPQFPSPGEVGDIVSSRELRFPLVIQTDNDRATEWSTSARLGALDVPAFSGPTLQVVDAHWIGRAFNTAGASAEWEVELLAGGLGGSRLGLARLRRADASSAGERFDFHVAGTPRQVPAGAAVRYTVRGTNRSGSGQIVTDILGSIRAKIFSN